MRHHISLSADLKVFCGSDDSTITNRGDGHVKKLYTVLGVGVISLYRRSNARLGDRSSSRRQLPPDARQRAPVFPLALRLTRRKMMLIHLIDCICRRRGIHCALDLLPVCYDAAIRFHRLVISPGLRDSEGYAVFSAQGEEEITTSPSRS